MEEKYNGLYRGIVVENNVDDNNYGAIRVFVPYLMDNNVLKKFFPNNKEIKQEITDDTVESLSNVIPEDFPVSGFIAYPASFPIGGYNVGNKDSYFLTSVYVPAKGSYVWVFFENGDLHRPFYLNSIVLHNAKLPPENRNVKNPAQVYTIIKTRKGRSIIVSDSADVGRVEITGRRRLIDKDLDKLPEDEAPGGNPESAYTISDNMNTILIEETAEGEQILIQTYKNDFIRLNIKDNSLDIRMNGSVRIHATDNITIKSFGSIILDAKNINIQSSAKTVVFSDNITKICSKRDIEISAGDSVSMNSSTNEIEYTKDRNYLERADVEEISPVVRYTKPNKDAREEDEVGMEEPK